MIKFYCILSFIISLFFTFCNTIAEAKDQEKLLKMVVLSRHGVRPPIETHEYLNEWTEKGWPYWTVREGYLTPRGSVLVSAFWGALQNEFCFEELFPKNMCPEQQLVYVRANTLERTQATAIAILNGLAPGCDLRYTVLDSKKPDPLFMPLESGFCSFNLSQAIKEFNQIYGGIEQLKVEFKEPLNTLVEVLGSCPEKTCKAYGLPSGCTFMDIPSELAVTSENDIYIKGGLGFASLAGQLFSLELAEWPKGNLAGMEVSRDTLKKVIGIHSKVFSTTHQVPEVAKCKASGILKAITEALTSTAEEPEVNKAKLVVFVGHDANIISLAGLLSLNWNVGGYGPEIVPPGSTLIFTLWDTPKGPVVRAHFACPTLESLTSASIYPQKIAKEQLSLIPPDMRKNQKVSGVECSTKQFKEWVENVLHKESLSTQPALLIKKRML